MTTARVTQDTARVVSNAIAKGRITQNSVRVVSLAISNAHVTQVTARVVSTNSAPAGGNQSNFFQFF